eukprot:COSAG06_NODE_39490_length_412_cov_0.648562_1_plen_29_part_10
MTYYIYIYIGRSTHQRKHLDISGRKHFGE